MNAVRWARKAAWLLWAATLVLAVLGLALMVWDWSTPVPRGFFGIRGFYGLDAVGFGGVGALLTWRRPGHPVGWLFAVAGLLAAVNFATFEYGLAASAGHRLLPGAGYVGWVEVWIWLPLITLVTLYLFLLFPDGRLPTPRWRPVAWLGGAFAVIATAGIAFFDGSDRPNLPGLRNPFGLAPAAVPLGMTVAGLAGLLSCVVLAAWSLVVRSRRGTDLTRQQIKWLAYSGCLVALALVPAVALSLTPGLPARVASGAVEAAALTIPAAVAVAVLRYRLYDLDLVVRKAVVAALVAAAFTGAYALVVAGAGAVTGHAGGGELAFAAAALAAVALQPVRVRAGRLADRLVYGRRASPYEVLSEFADRVAGTYSTEEVLPAMARMLAGATGAERAEVWLRSGASEQLEAAWPATPGAGDPQARQAGPDGLTRVFAVEHRGERLGELRVTCSPSQPLTPAGDRLVRDVAAQAGLVLCNVGLIEDLRASRQRLVAAADEARRGLERNLHDGAQQQLVALRISLGLARQVMASSPEEAAGLLAQTEHDAEEALRQLRELAHGIYPALLANLGLVAALEAQARKAAVPVTVTAAGVGRYPQQVEAAVYFCILEALQNVAKYAQASAARVMLSHDGRYLAFTVQDDGRGFDPATTAMGSGAQGMSDRLAALGGSLDVFSALGHGTRVTGQVPATTATPAPVTTAAENPLAARTTDRSG